MAQGVDRIIRELGLPNAIRSGYVMSPKSANGPGSGASPNSKHKLTPLGRKYLRRRDTDDIQVEQLNDD